MNNPQLYITDIMHLCSRFEVPYSVTIEPIESEDRVQYLAHTFGKVKGLTTIGNGLNQHDYYEISLRLAATYPEKVLPRED